MSTETLADIAARAHDKALAAKEHRQTADDDISSMTILDPVEAAHRRFAESRVELDRLDYEMRRAFERLTNATEQLRAIGVKADVVLNPPLEAALATWRSNGPREQRVEFDSIGPAPVAHE